MLDAVLEHSPAHLLASARVPEQSPVFEGHFPGFPLLPGVLMVEAMAQAGGWLVVMAGGFTRMAVLAKVSEAKMRGMVRPGAALRIHAELVHDGSGYAVTRGRLEDDGGARLADAELTLKTLPFPDPSLEGLMRARAVRLGLPA